MRFCLHIINRVTQLNCLSMTNIRFTTGKKAKYTNGKFRQCATKCKMQLSRIYSHKQFGYKPPAYCSTVFIGFCETIPNCLCVTDTQLLCSLSVLGRFAGAKVLYIACIAFSRQLLTSQVLIKINAIWLRKVRNKQSVSAEFYATG